MSKPSLETSCDTRKITINRRFGCSYSPGEARNREKEMRTDFMGLTETLSAVLEL
jgi:hypothetical protein